MAYSLRVDDGTITQLQNDVAAQCGQMTTQLGKLNQGMMALRQGWEGDSAQAGSAYYSQWVQQMGQHTDLLWDISRALGEIEQQYQQADAMVEALWSL